MECLSESVVHLVSSISSKKCHFGEKCAKSRIFEKIGSLFTSLMEIDCDFALASLYSISRVLFRLAICSLRSLMVPNNFLFT